MSAVTATYEIPYPQSTDRFCDGWSYAQQMAERVEDLLDGFDADVAELKQPPAVRISAYSVEPLFPDTTNLVPQYNTVDFDTTGMADLSKDPEGFSYPSDGIWLTGGIAFIRNQLNGTAPGTNTVLYDLYADSGGGYHTAVFDADQTDPGASLSVTFIDRALSGQSNKMNVGYRGTPLAPPRADVVSMYAVRLADR